MVFSILLLPMQAVCASPCCISRAPERHGHDAIHGLKFIRLRTTGHEQTEVAPSIHACVKTIDKHTPGPGFLDYVWEGFT